MLHMIAWLEHLSKTGEAFWPAKQGKKANTANLNKNMQLSLHRITENSLTLDNKFEFGIPLYNCFSNFEFLFCYQDLGGGVILTRAPP